jgi:hypothetical protein
MFTKDPSSPWPESHKCSSHTITIFPISFIHYAHSTSTSLQCPNKILYGFIVLLTCATCYIRLIFLNFINFVTFYKVSYLPIPVDKRSKTRICGRSFAGIVASYPPPPPRQHRCLSLSVVWALRRADPSSRGDLPTDCGVSVSLIWKPHEWGGPGQSWAVASKRE